MPAAVGGEPLLSQREREGERERRPDQSGRVGESRTPSTTMLALLAMLQLGGPRAEGPANGIEPSDEPLRVAFRPPKQTAAQATAMDKVYADAAAQSAAAKPWALSYMGSSAVRGRLDASLQHYSDEQLLDMFTWEFQRLPLMHNAPLDSYGATLAAVQDDTPMNVTLDNGYLQTPCQRYTLGGPEDWTGIFGYSFMYSGFGVESDASWTMNTICGFTSTLRGANDCLLFSANNLFKTHIGNTGGYGAVTYLLNRKRMAKRMLLEIWDGGLLGVSSIISSICATPFVCLTREDRHHRCSRRTTRTSGRSSRRRSTTSSSRTRRRGANTPKTTTTPSPTS